MTTNTRKCLRCGETKVLTEFRRDKLSKTGYRNVCKVCSRGVDRPRPSRRATVVVFNGESEAKRRAIFELIDRHRQEYEKLVNVMRTRVAGEIAKAS